MIIFVAGLCRSASIHNHYRNIIVMKQASKNTPVYRVGSLFAGCFKKQIASWLYLRRIGVLCHKVFINAMAIKMYYSIGLTQHVGRIKLFFQCLKSGGSQYLKFELCVFALLYDLC